MLHSFATQDPKTSRQFKEKRHYNLYRSSFGQDRDRIIESNAFRRLQYKTQVFVNFHGDHYRNRLTHSLEVAQIARWIASGLELNKDLAEIISLAHDLGHSPFGHAGEDALNYKINQYDPSQAKFCHNAQAIKVVTNIENRFLQFKGLNLCKETIEGIAKHNGSFKGKYIHPIIQGFDSIYNINLFKQPSLEAQISSCADDVAYNNHDLEDGIKDELFSLDDLKEIEFFSFLIKQINNDYTNITRNQTIGELKKRATSLMVIDIIENTAKKSRQLGINTIEQVEGCQNFIVSPSSKMQIDLEEIRKFLFENMYKHPKVQKMSNMAKQIISTLFDYYIARPELIPEQFYCQHNKVQMVVDYISGMTDRYANKKYNQITNA